MDIFGIPAPSKRIEPIGRKEFRRRFAILFPLQVFVLGALYLLVSQSALDLASTIYLDMAVGAVAVICDAILFERMNTRGRIFDIYNGAVGPNAQVTFFSLMYLPFAIPILYLALTRPSGRGENAPWFLRGYLPGVCILSYFIVLPLVAFASLFFGNLDVDAIAGKPIARWVLGPTGYAVVSTGMEAQAVDKEHRERRALSLNLRSDALRASAASAEISATGLYRTAAHAVNYCGVIRKPLPKWTAAERGCLEDVLFVFDLFPSKQERLNTFSPLIVLLPSAMFEAAAINLVQNYSRANYIARAAGVSEKISEGMIRSRRPNRLLASEARASWNNDELSKADNAFRASLVGKLFFAR